MLALAFEMLFVLTISVRTSNKPDKGEPLYQPGGPRLPQEPPSPPYPEPEGYSPLTNHHIHKAVSDWCAGTVGKKFGVERTYGPIADWDTSKVTNMSELFAGKSTCNPEIGEWNTAKVTTMAAMFAFASSFNQDLGKWDTAAVKSMDYMFSGATVFNQPLCWSKNADLTTTDMFNNSACPPVSYTDWWLKSCWGEGTRTSCTAITPPKFTKTPTKLPTSTPKPTCKGSGGKCRNYDDDSVCCSGRCVEKEWKWGQYRCK